MDEIYSRRSIRQYTAENVSQGLIEKVLMAGMNAPSARNKKPYEFIVVRDKMTLERLSLVKQHAYMVKGSDVTIVLVSDEASSWWQVDLGAVVQNMLLEAEHNGIGSCWIGINETDEAAVKQILDVPEGLRVATMVSFGYPAEGKDKNDNYYIEKIHHEKY